MCIKVIRKSDFKEFYRLLYVYNCMKIIKLCYFWYKY